MDKQNVTPDLQSILATLAEFAPPLPVAQSGGRDSHSSAASHTGYGFNGSGSSEASLKLPSDRANQLLQPQRNSNNSTPPQQLIDPASITTWQDGLRCVTKIAAQNPHFSTAIKTVGRTASTTVQSDLPLLIVPQMIDRQRKTELRWYSERQQLKQTQARREISAAKAQSILASLNADATKSPSDDQSSVDKDEELASFDLRIYTASQQMEKSMSLELKALGVPFFGTDSNLIVAETQDPNPASSMPDSHPKWSAPVTEAQLLLLRRRMITHLEDLYKD